MTARMDALEKVEKAKAFVARIEADIAHAIRWNHGRGAADDRVGLHFANVELQNAQAALAAMDDNGSTTTQE